MKAPAAAAVLLATFAAAPGAAGEPSRYRYDPVHTQVLFSVDHLGFSRPVGRFTRVGGWLEFDADDLARTRCEVTIDAASLFLGDADWEKKVRSDAFLDAGRHPRLRYACGRVEALAVDRARLHGQLTLRGVTRPVVLEVAINRVGRHTYSMAYVAGFSATGTIRRSDFGLRRMLPAVGDEVSIRLEVEAIRE